MNVFILVFFFFLFFFIYLSLFHILQKHNPSIYVCCLSTYIREGGDIELVPKVLSLCYLILFVDLKTLGTFTECWLVCLKFFLSKGFNQWFKSTEGLILFIFTGDVYPNPLSYPWIKFIYLFNNLSINIDHLSFNGLNA